MEILKKPEVFEKLKKELELKFPRDKLILMANNIYKTYGSKG